MGLPPTSLKASTDSNPVTTFFLEFPFMKAVHTGVKAVMGLLDPAGIDVGASSAGDVITNVAGTAAWAPAGGGGTPAVVCIYTAVNTLVAGGAVLKYDTAIVDTNSAYNTSTGVFTAPVTGYYVVTWGAASITRNTSFALKINGNPYRTNVYSTGATTSVPGATVVYLAINDQLFVYNDTFISEQMSAFAPDNTLAICSISGSMATSIANSPLTTKGDLWGYAVADTRVAVGSNGQVLVADSTAAAGVSWQTPTAALTAVYSIINAASVVIPSNNTIVIYNNVVDDPASLYNTSTGVWTCPVGGDGLYGVSWCVAQTAAQIKADLRKNTVSIATGLYSVGATAAAQGYTVVNLTSGDTIDVYNTAGGGYTMTSTNSDNRFEIIRISS